MTILVDRGTKVMVWGMTGAQGSFQTRLMLDYGTKIVAGVTPGKGGAEVQGVPVYDTALEALREHDADASIIFAPASSARDAAFEAISAGLSLIVVITEHVPLRDEMEIVAYAGTREARVIGPNAPGVISPEETKIGIMPGHIFRKGNIGLVSRSGTLTYEIASRLTSEGLGQSTCLGIGGDPVVGLSFIEVLELFEEDTETEAVVLIGEIGGNMEELTADYVKSGYPKPVVGFIAGRSAPAGKRMGHAGAIIIGHAGTAETKMRALREAGVPVAERPSDIPALLREKMKRTSLR
jgi:succinyl-CoA synthetase alpha subunit